jgi:hypothetical protein
MAIHLGFYDIFSPSTLIADYYLQISHDFVPYFPIYITCTTGK